MMPPKYFNRETKKSFFVHNLIVSSVLLSSSAFADAYDQLRDIAGGGSVYVPPASNPKCVEGCDNSAYDDGSNRRSLFDAIRERAEEAEQQRQADERKQKQEAFKLNEEGNHAFEKQQWATAIEYYKKALNKSPNDKVIKSNLEGAQREFQKIEDRKNEQSQYRKNMQRFAALMPIPKPQSIHENKVPSLNALPGLTHELWKEYFEVQEIANNLYIKLNRDGALSDADSQKFYTALNRRNELWNIAVQEPLTDLEREKLTLILPTAIDKTLLNLDAIKKKLDPSSKVLPAEDSVQYPDRRTDKKSLESDAITTVFMSDFFSDQASKMIESQVGETIEMVHGETMKNRYDNLLGVAHIAVEGKENGIGAAASGTVDFIISKMPEPMAARADMTIEGGRIYSNVAYRALNRVMVDAMKVTGANFDSEAFWKHFNEDMTDSQKGVKQWIQFGE